MLKSRVLTAGLRDVDVLLDAQLGDVLSSRFWILFANSLLKLLNNAFFFTVGLADYLFLIKGKSVRMQVALNIVKIDSGNTERNSETDYLG